MPEESSKVDQVSTAEVDRFIIDEIDSVPHLEALLLLWRSAPQRWAAAELGAQLYVPAGYAVDIAEDLQRRGLIDREGEGASFFFDRKPERRNHLLSAVDAAYRRELIRISGIIHSKASPGVRAFANAFRFRKEKS